MSERFYAPAGLSQAAVPLDGLELHHLSSVLRLRAGDEVTLFDGHGSEATARIESVSKRQALLSVLDVRITEPPAPPRLILATAVPKGDRFRWLVEKATELGVDRLVPLATARSVVDPREGKLDRLRLAVIAACKQCGRNRLMEIAPATRWETFLSSSGECDGGTRLVAHPDGIPWAGVASRLPAGPVVGAIGPEGGFTDEEIRAAIDAGWTAVSLGPFILRIETAATALAAAVRVNPRWQTEPAAPRKPIPDA